MRASNQRNWIRLDRIESIDLWVLVEDWWVYHGLPALVMTDIAIENGPVEIVEFPIKNGGSFQFAMLVYQRVFVYLLSWFSWLSWLYDVPKVSRRHLARMVRRRRWWWCCTDCAGGATICLCVLWRRCTHPYVDARWTPKSLEILKRKTMVSWRYEKN